MSKSLNKLQRVSNTYIKEYGPKKPIWKYKFRSILNDIGIRQPVEYYNNNKRLAFEKDCLILWKKYNLNVPEVIKVKKNRLVLANLNGKTLEAILEIDKNPKKILTLLFLELNSRHTLALQYNEKHLAHIDANLRNILLCDNKIYHVDFEMGREKESIENWLQRELSKLLISILQKQDIQKRKEILKLFLKLYEHTNILKNLFKSKLGEKVHFSSDCSKTPKYSLKKIIYEIQYFFPKDFLNIMLPQKKNILIIYSARFGDILISTPTLRAIKEYWKNSNITFLTHPSRKEILEHTPLIDKVGDITNKKVYLSKLNLKKAYDIAFVINKDNQGFVKYAQNYSQYTIAFTTNNKNIDKKLFIREVYPRQHSKHSVDMRLSILEHLNISPSKKQLEYIVTKGEKTWAKNYIKGIHNHFLIGIQANSFHTKSYRNWPIQNFINLCKTIQTKKTNVHFLLFGSKDDVKNLLPLQNELKENCSMLAGNLTLRQTAAIMSRTNLYIGVDTGPTHIMGTFNKPMVVLYHSFNSSKLLKPLENPNFIPIDHPFSELGAKEPPMSDISIKSVFEQVKKFL